MRIVTVAGAMRAVLDEAAFAKLVLGEEVELVAGDGVEVRLILADIGWSRMLLAINRAIKAQEERVRSGG